MSMWLVAVANQALSRYFILLNWFINTADFRFCFFVWLCVHFKSNVHLKIRQKVLKHCIQFDVCVRVWAFIFRLINHCHYIWFVISYIQYSVFSMRIMPNHVSKIILKVESHTYVCSYEHICTVYESKSDVFIFCSIYLFCVYNRIKKIIIIEQNMV